MGTRASGAGGRVLVTAASKHGATAQIAERIGEVLGGHGLEVTVDEPARVSSVDGFDAVVLGSAVYAGHWLSDAKDLVDRIGQREPRPPVWLFSSGPLGDPPKPDEDPVDVAAVTAALAPRDHRVFAGKIDKSQLGFGERAIMIAVRAPEGDFRDWAAITQWADGIAEALGAPADRAGA